jgi:imidazolonepropionase-like amidohydrolase
MDIWIRDLRADRDRRLTSMPGPEMTPAWSPDGSRIAFTASGGLFVVPADGGEPKSIYRGFVGYPSWARDGSFLVVTTTRPYTSRRREGVTYYSIVPVDGGPPTLVIPQEHEAVGSLADGAALAPDGKHLAFIRHSFVHVLPVAPDGRPTGPARQLTSELADSVSWASPDQILYIATDRLKLVSVADGRTRDMPLDLVWTRKIPDGRLVVHAGRLIDGVQPAPRTGMDIVIEKNRIVAIEPHQLGLHAGRVVDASNQSVMAGLIEGHTHLQKSWGTRWGRIHLAYGITSTRDPGAEPYEAIEEREAVESGRRPGPRHFTTGNILDGARTAFPVATFVPNEEAMDLQVEHARRLDFDLLKTYLYLPIPLQKRAIEGSHRLGIPITSHDIYPAALFGADSVEHLRAHDRRNPTSSKHSPLGHAYQDVIEIVAKSGMTITPTSALRTFRPAVSENPALASDPRMRLQLPFVIDGLRDLLPEAGAKRKVMIRKDQPEEETIGKLYRAGATIIAGIDSPSTPYAVGLHIELQDYVAQGLTPFDALRTATVNTAALLGVADQLGTIEKGKLADLVIVDGNPLANINDAMNVRAVIKNGEVFTLEQLLESPARLVTSR